MGQTNIIDARVRAVSTSTTKDVLHIRIDPAPDYILGLRTDQANFGRLYNRLKIGAACTIEYDSDYMIVDVLPLRTYVAKGKVADVLNITRELSSSAAQHYQIILDTQLESSHRIISLERGRFDVGRRYSIEYQFNTAHYHAVRHVENLWEPSARGRDLSMKELAQLPEII